MVCYLFDLHFVPCGISGMTLEAIAKADGTVSKSTVHEALKEDITFQNWKVNLPDKTIGQDGKARPTKYKPRKQKTVYIAPETVKKIEALPEKHKSAVLFGDKRPMGQSAKIQYIEP